MRAPSRLEIRVSSDDIMEESESIKSSDEDDSILDGCSDESEIKSSSDIEIDSEWSEADEIFGAHNTDALDDLR